MGRPKKDVVENMPQVKNERINEDNIIKCPKCEKTQVVNVNYYKSKSPLYTNGYIVWCKECIWKTYEQYYKLTKDIKTSIYIACLKFDIPFSETNYEGVIKQQLKDPTVHPFKTYMKNINSLGSVNNIPSGFDPSELLNKNINKKESIEIEDVDDNLDFEINQEMVSFWGTNNKLELFFLENEWHNLITRFECDSYSTEMLFQEIAQQRLDIKKKRKESTSVDKELKTLQDLLGSANIKPVQETGANASEQVSFGVLMKKWENEKPIPKPEKEWEDVDGIRRYISIWFLGHLCKMLNLNNDYSKMYEKEMEKYRVELSEDLGDE